MFLSRVALQEGNAAESEKLARQAVEALQVDKLVDNEADARDALASALMAEGKVADAQTEIDSAERLSPQDLGVKMSLAVADAKAKSRSGRVAEAQQDLDAKLREAVQLKLIGSQLEIELARAEIRKLSDPTGAKADLQALAVEARRKGYGLVAKQAELQLGPVHR